MDDYFFGQAPEFDNAALRRSVDQIAIDFHNTSPGRGGVSPHALVYGQPSILHPRSSWMLDGDRRTDDEADAAWHIANNLLLSPHDGPSSVSSLALRTFASYIHDVPSFDAASAYIPPPLAAPSSSFPAPAPHINSKVMRRILATRESIFKYGVYLPKSDYDANNSPERDRWRSGRKLEWLRLKNIGAFEYDWTISRMNAEYPDYAISDIDRLFYIYDYKFTGEHRVRLVFDGSRQSPSTYNLAYSPTVRSESIRLFHVYAVEMDWDIRQFDVPQAFLQSFIDHVIFVHPPRAHVERPGQILKLRLALYGAKQSSALFYKLLNAFLLSIGFISSTMDPCFYRRHDVSDTVYHSIIISILYYITSIIFIDIHGTRYLGQIS